MNARELKEYIYENKRVEYILEEIGMKYIQQHNNYEYFSCCQPDGDNRKSTIIKNNEHLSVKAYTRDIIDKYGNSDIISLICFIKNIYFSNALKYICDLLGLDYYSSLDDELPESIRFTKFIEEMSNSKEEYKEEKLKPISETILTYYKPYVTDFFKNDGINYHTQQLFELGYDLDSHRITIPIRDEIGNLVGIKGRLFKKELKNDEEKYIYLEPCAKSHILYGLNITMPFIKEKNECIVVESEKNVLKMWDVGIKNVVAIGGHDLSSIQVEKLIRLGCKEIIICYDEDVYRMKNGKIDFEGYEKELNKFIKQQYVSFLIDVEGNILDKKESPSDNYNKFIKMYNKRTILR